MKYISKNELEFILSEHKRWLESGGDEGRRANLSGASLRGAYLSGADLRNAALSGANLNGADLSYADLRSAYLSDANLSYADLRSADLSYADLSDANLSYAYLSDADLSDANLGGADLRGADLDYASFPLWCGGLDVHIDDRQAIQLLYHLLRNVKYSKNTSKKLKKICKMKTLVKLANEFHRVDECGKIDLEDFVG